METRDALEIAKIGYSEYGKYVGMGRAYPRLQGGAKESYKRAIYGMWKDGPRSIKKVAELAAYALPYHPHPTSVSGVIVALGNKGNKLPLMKTQGNWGNSKSTRNVAPSADRYIGGMLSDLAIDLLCDSFQYAPEIEGEICDKEPEALPALIPLCFINGASGIPSGLPTLNIPSINILQMFDYYMEILKHKSLDYKPKWYPDPNLECNIVSSREDWNGIMRTGKGKLRLAPVMELEGNKIEITAMPDGKNQDDICKILSNEIEYEKVDFIDESSDTDLFIVEKVPKKWYDMNEAYQKLYNKLQSTENYNMAFYDNEHIYVPLGFDPVVKANIEYLIKVHTARITKQLEQLNAKLQVLEIIENMKSENKIHELFNLDTDGAIEFIIKTYNTDDKTASTVLQKPMSYLTRSHQPEIDELRSDIKSLQNDKDDIYDFLYKKYKEVRKKVANAIKDKFIPTNFV